MRHVAAYMLASLGSEKPTLASLKAILESVGVEADEDSLKVVIDKLQDKKVDQVQAAGEFLQCISLIIKFVFICLLESFPTIVGHA